MYKHIFILIASGMLVGCAHNPPKETVPEVVIKTEVQKIKVPAALLIIPDRVAPIDLNKASQKTVARWLVDINERMEVMQKNLTAIKKFND